MLECILVLVCVDMGCRMCPGMSEALHRWSLFMGDVIVWNEYLRCDSVRVRCTRRAKTSRNTWHWRTHLKANGLVFLKNFCCVFVEDVNKAGNISWTTLISISFPVHVFCNFKQTLFWKAHWFIWDAAAISWNFQLLYHNLKKTWQIFLPACVMWSTYTLCSWRPFTEAFNLLSLALITCLSIVWRNIKLNKLLTPFLVLSVGIFGVIEIVKDVWGYMMAGTLISCIAELTKWLLKLPP